LTTIFKSSLNCRLLIRDLPPHALHTGSIKEIENKNTGSKYYRVFVGRKTNFYWVPNYLSTENQVTLEAAQLIK
jgi:hypothetical protein